MTFDGDYPGEMHRLPFRDPQFDEMADRLLTGKVPATDVPPAYRGLAELFETVAGSPAAGETAHKATVLAAAMAAMDATVHSAVHASQTPVSRRRSMLSKVLTAKAAAAATVAALGLGTAAAAATGSLPMQGSHAGSHPQVGLTISASNSSGSNAGNGSNSQGTNSSKANTTGAAGNDHAQFGLCTAFLAQHPTSSSPTVPSDKSKTFSAFESESSHNGLSATWTYCTDTVLPAHAKATQNGANTGSTPDDTNADKPDNAGPKNSTPPVSTPNGGGTGTADTASGGASDTGAGTASSHTGAGTAGSGNAGGH